VASATEEAKLRLRVLGLTKGVLLGVASDRSKADQMLREEVDRWNKESKRWCEEENVTKRKRAASNGGGALSNLNDWFVFVGVLRPWNIHPRCGGESGVPAYPKNKSRNYIHSCYHEELLI
jgi:hypothetical protein